MWMGRAGGVRSGGWPLLALALLGATGLPAAAAGASAGASASITAPVSSTAVLAAAVSSTAGPGALQGLVAAVAPASDPQRPRAVVVAFN